MEREGWRGEGGEGRAERGGGEGRAERKGEGKQKEGKEKEGIRKRGVWAKRWGEWEEVESGGSGGKRKQEGEGEQCFIVTSFCCLNVFNVSSFFEMACLTLQQGK